MEKCRKDSTLNQVWHLSCRCQTGTFFVADKSEEQMIGARETREDCRQHRAPPHPLTPSHYPLLRTCSHSGAFCAGVQSLSLSLSLSHADLEHSNQC
eukprot:3932035-Rhodomonas_salina.2